MREQHIRKLMKVGCLVVVRVPSCRRKELEKQNIFVSEYIDGKIIDVVRLAAREQCQVMVRDGMGRDISVLAGSVIKLKGRGDRDGSRFGKRPMRRKRKRPIKREQMRLFGE